MATSWWGSTFPANDASAPLGIRIASGGVCSNESGIEKRRILMGPDVAIALTSPKNTPNRVR